MFLCLADSFIGRGDPISAAGVAVTCKIIAVAPEGGLRCFSMRGDYHGLYDQTRRC